MNPIENSDGRHRLRKALSEAVSLQNEISSRFSRRFDMFYARCGTKRAAA